MIPYISISAVSLNAEVNLITLNANSKKKQLFVSPLKTFFFLNKKLNTNVTSSATCPESTYEYLSEYFLHLHTINMQMETFT